MTGNQSHSSTAANSFSSHNVVGVHYRVGKKIGEGSFGIIYEGEEKLIPNAFLYVCVYAYTYIYLHVNASIWQ